MFPFSIGYVKGQTRALTLLTLLSLCMGDGVKLNEALDPSWCNEEHV